MSKSRIVTVVLAVMLIVGLSLLLYPLVSDYWNDLHQSKAIAQYAENVAQMDEAAYNKILQDAADYNAELKNKSRKYNLTESELKVYNSMLNVAGNGVMGYVEVPCIGVSLPIYHGVDEAVLQIAIGHIEWSSLPIGGEGTHSAISGHRGLPSAKLFTDLDKVKKKDLFVVRVLNEVYTYEVDQIRIVSPDDVKDLEIEDGKDYCTLVTCTPYGINSHRLLVRGHRVENVEITQTVRVIADATQIEPLIMAPIVAIPMLIAFTLYVVFKPVKKQPSKEEE